MVLQIKPVVVVVVVVETITCITNIIFSTVRLNPSPSRAIEPWVRPHSIASRTTPNSSSLCSTTCSDILHITLTDEVKKGMPQFFVKFEALICVLCLEYESRFTSSCSLSLLQTVYHRKKLYLSLLLCCSLLFVYLGLYCVTLIISNNLLNHSNMAEGRILFLKTCHYLLIDSLWSYKNKLSE